MTYQEFLEVNHLTDTELVRLAYDLCEVDGKKEVTDGTEKEENEQDDLH